MTDSLTPSAATPQNLRTSFSKKPLRFKFGIALLILYPFMWLFAAIVPFLPLDVGVKAAIVGGDLVAAEIVFVLAVACVGKETYLAIKAKLLKRKRGKAAPSAD